MVPFTVPSESDKTLLVWELSPDTKVKALHVSWVRRAGRGVPGKATREPDFPPWPRALHCAKGTVAVSSPRHFLLLHLGPVAVRLCCTRGLQSAACWGCGPPRGAGACAGRVASHARLYGG